MNWGSIVLLVIFVESLLLVIIGAYRIKLAVSKKEKNKVKYDLREIMFYIEPLGDESYMLRFKYGDQLIFQEPFTDSDIYVNPSLPFKLFVKWCEEDYGGN